MTARINKQFWESQKDSSFFHNQIITRTTALSLSVLRPVEGAVQHVGGACLGLLSIVSGGGYETLNTRANKLLNRSIVSDFFQCISHIINPFAKGVKEDKTILSLGGWSPAVGCKFDVWARNERNQEGFVRSVINSRLLNLARFPVVAAIRLVDNVIGLVAGVGSIATFGKVPQLYSIACRGLSISNVVQDLYVSIIWAINPDAELDSVRVDD